MSEIKPRYYSARDFTTYKDINADEAASIANSKLVPVLKMMKEMAEVLTEATDFIDDMNNKKTYSVGNISTKPFKKLIKSYKSFLSQIKSEAGE